MTGPTIEHLKVVAHVLRYLKFLVSVKFSKHVTIFGDLD